MMRTQAEKALELSERQARIREHYEAVIARAPELTFFQSRAQTEKLASPFLKSLYIDMCLKHLTDVQVEGAQKAYEILLAAKNEYKGTHPAPDGITHIQGYIQDTMRVENPKGFRGPNRALIIIREDRGFIVRLTCPLPWIQEAGSLKGLMGRRISCTVDLMPTTGDHTLAVRRPRKFGGNSGGHLTNMKLHGNHFDDLEA